MFNLVFDLLAYDIIWGKAYAVTLKCDAGIVIVLRRRLSIRIWTALLQP